MQETCLNIAVQHNFVDIVKLLVVRGANVRIPRCYGDERQSNESLAKSSEAKLALQQCWSPSTHSYYPKSKKDLIKLSLLIAKRNNWPFPGECVALDFGIHSKLEQFKERKSKIVCCVILLILRTIKPCRFFLNKFGISTKVEDCHKKLLVNNSVQNHTRSLNYLCPREVGSMVHEHKLVYKAFSIKNKWYCETSTSLSE